MEQLKEKIAEIIVDILDVDEGILEEEIPFSQNKRIVWDSIKALDILAALEKEFKIRIDEEYMPKMDTMDGILRVIGDLTKASN